MLGDDAFLITGQDKININGVSEISRHDILPKKLNEFIKNEYE